MFLKPVMRRNPELIKMAVRLHQSGEVDPTTYVIDADCVDDNASIIKDEAKRWGLSLWPMTKQIGRNPIISRIMMADTPGAVAVDIEGARSLHRHNIPVAHLGHLLQIPVHDLEFTLSEIQPKVMTVFTVEKAKQVSQTAAKLGITQKLLVRIIGKNDFFYPLQEGGFKENEVLDAVRRITRFPAVKVVGVTSFPCLVFDTITRRIEATPNFDTVLRATQRLNKELGIDIEVINAPGTTSSATMELLSKKGATHVEPGHGFTGTTPLHAFEDLPEIPAIVYVTEVSHIFEGDIFTFGYGISPDFLAGGQYTVKGFVGRDPDRIFEKEISLKDIFAGMDYIARFTSSQIKDIHVGDTVVMAFRQQISFSRSRAAIVLGLRTGKPTLAGIFDRTGNLLQNHGEPVGLADTLDYLDRLPFPYQKK